MATSPPPPPPSDEDRHKALHALQNMATPKPKANAGPQPQPEMTPMSGASGFVGMLQKGKLGSGDSHVPAADGGKKGKYALPVAKEVGVKPEAPRVEEEEEVEATAAELLAEAAAARRPVAKRVGPRPVTKAVPGWVVPVLVVFGVLLVVIGGWAVGAIVYMRSATVGEPTEVKYPLLRWEFDETANELVGDYTAGTKGMAWGMTACLPVGLGVSGMAVMARRGRRRSAA